MCDCTSVCVLGAGVVLRLSSVVTEAPWRHAIQPSGQVIHTGANIVALTTNKHLVSMELDLLWDTHSEAQEVFKSRAQPAFMSQIPILKAGD